MSRPRRPRGPRRARSSTETLGAIVLGFESVVVFLAGLVIFGLRAVPAPVEPWWGIVAGSVLAVVMLLTAGVLRHRWGIILGWALQVVLALGAILVPAVLIVALVFGGMWAYATIKGAELDRRRAASASPEPEANGD